MSVEQDITHEITRKPEEEPKPRGNNPNIEEQRKAAVWQFAVETGLMRPWLVELIYPDRVREIERGLEAA